IGTRAGQQTLIALSAASALTALASVWTRKPLSTFRSHSLMAFAAILAGIAAVGWGLVSTVSEIPWQVIAYGRRVAPILRGTGPSSEATPVFIGEGMNSSVVITDRAGQRFFYVSGKPEASSGLLDMRLQRMMGHLPALVHPRPESVLVVGFGAGVTAGSFVPYPELDNITIS